MKFLFLTFVVAPGIVFGPIALILGVTSQSLMGFVAGAIITAFSWGILLKMSEDY